MVARTTIARLFTPSTSASTLPDASSKLAAATALLGPEGYHGAEMITPRHCNQVGAKKARRTARATATELGVQLQKFQAVIARPPLKARPRALLPAKAYTSLRGHRCTGCNPDGATLVVNASSLSSAITAAGQPTPLSVKKCNGECRLKDCGCPGDAGVPSWCANTNTKLFGDYCNKNDVNCGNCNGKFCY